MDHTVQSKKVDHDLLSQSYTRGVERLTGLQTSTYGLSSKVLQNRQKFWNKLFLKYTGHVSDETGTDDANIAVPIKKSLMSIQYWVNTGYLPTDANVILSVHSKSCTSVESESFDFLHHRHTREACYENSTASSVDTAAYILSNNNTTSKVETMAIVEGAKHDTQGNSRNVIQTNSHEIVDTRNTLFRNSEHCYDKLSNEKPIGTIYDLTKRNSFVTQNSLNVESTNTNKSIRKKLYTRTNSPIDLLHAKSDNNLTSKSKKYIHPALNSGSKRKKRHTICTRGKLNKRSFVFNKNLTDGDRFSVLKEKCRRRDRSYFDDIIPLSDLPSRCKGSLDRGNSSTIKNLTTHQNLIQCTDKSSNTSNSKKCEKHHEAIERRQHLNPVVCLKRLSESDLQNFQEKKRNTKAKDPGNLNPVVCLRRLSDNDIKITCTDDAKTTSTNSSLLLDVEVQTSDTNSMQHSSFLFCKPESIHFVEDTDSSLSTLFIYKCESGIFHNGFSANKSFMSSNNHHRLDTAAKERLNQTDGELNSKFFSQNFISNVCSRSKIMANNIRHLHDSIRDKRKDEDIRKRKKSKIFHNIQISSDSFFKEDYERDAIRPLNVSVNSSIASSSDKSRDICKNRFNDNLNVNNDEPCLSLDEDDGFVELVHKYYSTWK
ncbi:uncharacterized protein LOC128882061 [Hylaeus volcanicus]|uniref:uncharacterized protein LOC128882061 n=1 Tax=Hylaeus volcanicus TaxID=313075 RepID=UPI0023B83A64|nr:uncharacterized protein LOC128882061 [Hylaeus volcanicus]